MRSARFLIAASVVLVAACSSSDDAAPTDTSVAKLEPAVSESADDAVTTDAAEPDSAAATTTTTAAVEPAATQPAPPATDPEPSATDAIDNDGLLIDGPATVRPSCDSLVRGVSEFTLDAGGAVRDVRIFVPDTIISDPAPTVLNWHGLGSNGPDQAVFTGYETLAATEGFLVVHATGVAGPDGGGNSWELTAFDTPERDDLAFADALIDVVVEDWCGDPNRIYSTGMSNGGLFTSELVCNRSDRIAAAASVAGTTHPPTCDPDRAVPYIAFHGTADSVVPFDGDEPSTLLPPAGVDALIDDTTPAEFAEFAADAGCDAEPTRVEETAEVIRYDYVSCDDGVPMAFYEIVGGGHTWPASPLAEVLADLGYFTQDIDATVDAWAFMSQHSL